MIDIEQPKDESCPECGTHRMLGHQLNCKRLGMLPGQKPSPELEAARIPAPSAKPDLKVVDLDDIPAQLREKRAQIREMLQARCALPDSPIPLHLATRCSDWIFLLALFRARERIKAGKPAFPDTATLQNDIARAAESVETVVVVMQEEARETLDGLARIIAPPGAR